jgi:hypothetical protein
LKSGAGVPSFLIVLAVFTMGIVSKCGIRTADGADNADFEFDPRYQRNPRLFTDSNQIVSSAARPL